MWYVVQVNTGREDAACELIKQAVDGSILDECFVPRYKTATKVRGKWVPCTEVLFPGYLIVVTSDVKELSAKLRKVKTFTKLLGNDKAFIPLNKEEIAWVESRTQRGDRTFDMSEGYIEDGVLHVLKGPLMGMEANVRKVSHRKKKAYLDLQMFGRTIHAEIGLKVVWKHTKN